VQRRGEEEQARRKAQERMENRKAEREMEEKSAEPCARRRRSRAGCGNCTTLRKSNLPHGRRL
jgi:hypothetical protein